KRGRVHLPELRVRAPDHQRRRARSRARREPSAERARLERQTVRNAPRYAENCVGQSARVGRGPAEFTSAGRGGACRPYETRLERLPSRLAPLVSAGLLAASALGARNAEAAREVKEVAAIHSELARRIGPAPAVSFERLHHGLPLERDYALAERKRRFR